MNVDVCVYASHAHETVTECCHNIFNWPCIFQFAKIDELRLGLLFLFIIIPKDNEQQMFAQ